MQLEKHHEAVQSKGGGVFRSIFGGFRMFGGQ
jgi:hypothetical protein